MTASARSGSCGQPSSKELSGRQRGDNASLPRSRSSPGTLSSRERPTGYIPTIGHFAVTGIPGYAGFIPGKMSENVCGTTFQRTNELSLQACELRATPPYEMPLQAYNPDGVSAHRRGYDMVGYTGFVPGKYANNVFGHVFTRTNAISSLIKGVQFEEKRKWIENLHNQAPPLPNSIGVVGYTGINGPLSRSQNLHRTRAAF
eukprot:GEMP01077430.1.p1 GENE.GEMP01077430.1~~GEMP01077430.1.p1  ORF type:complete len:211 (+),score=42.95 GEMP01077430.1:28-633(+)